MADLGFDYRTEELPESGNYDVIPAGWYSATITEADLKQNSQGTGHYIKIRFDITGPQHQGRVVFTNLNIRHQNPKAEEIALKSFGEILRSIGLSTCKDTDQLIGGNLEIKVGIRKTEEYGEQNEIKGYKASAGSAAVVSSPTQSQPQTQHKAPPRAEIDDRPPWAR